MATRPTPARRAAKIDRLLTEALAELDALLADESIRASSDARFLARAADRIHAERQAIVDATPTPARLERHARRLEDERGAPLT